MECWKNNFNQKTLKNGIKFKNNITNITPDEYGITACINSKYQVNLIIHDNILYDMSCSCSKKSGCVHEAGFLYFLEEFPEILEDLSQSITPVSQINIDDDLKIISRSKALKFLKHEFRNDSRLKYRFIKYFKTEPLIDKKDYEKKLKGILKYAREEGFKNHGHYNVRKLHGSMKKFLRDDIDILIKQEEYEFAYKLLEEIITIFMEDYYWDTPTWHAIVEYYQLYVLTFLECDCFSDAQKGVMRKTYERISYMKYKLRI